jgi:hypothetical protein
VHAKNPGKIFKAGDVVFIETASSKNSDAKKRIECAVDADEGTTVEGEWNKTNQDEDPAPT